MKVLPKYVKKWCDVGFETEHFEAMKAMTKTQLAKAAGVSRKTLMRWLRDPFIQAQMARYPLSPHQKKLPGSLIKIICEHYVIDIDQDT